MDHILFLLWQEVTGELLLDSFKQHKNAKGFILEGYPRDMEQVQEYMKVVCYYSTEDVPNCFEAYSNISLIQWTKQIYYKSR